VHPTLQDLAIIAFWVVGIAFQIFPPAPPRRGCRVRRPVEKKRWAPEGSIAAVEKALTGRST
jgi:hypothetical protein